MIDAIPVLDHGFVKLLNISGPTRRIHTLYDASDRDPAQAARMSFNRTGGDHTEEEDHRLSKYLMKNWHTSPFEMIEVWAEMKMPIFIARQFIRHRTTSINEVSGRYVTLPAEWYIPEVVGGKPINAKQGQSDGLDERTQKWFKDRLNRRCAESYADYLEAIERGVAPEHARITLHLNHYTHWLWKQDFHNLMHFMSLREHSHAMVEAQKYANAVNSLVRGVLPKSMELYDEFRKRP